MKKLLVVLGSVFAVLLIAAVIGFSFLAVEGSELDKESKSYVDDVIPKIAANLNKEFFFQFASDELKNSATDEEFHKVFKWFGKLGSFVEYKGSKGEATISVHAQNGKQITAKYVSQTEFESGPATINIQIIKRDNKWEILGFKVNSIALVN